MQGRGLLSPLECARLKLHGVPEDWRQPWPRTCIGVSWKASRAREVDEGRRHCAAGRSRSRWHCQRDPP